MSDRKVTNCESFSDELRAAELEVLTEITSALERDRQNVVSAFERMGVARAELGKVIAAYHSHFKAERAWLRITPVLLKWMDRTSLTTLYNLIGDGERDQSLSSPRRAAIRHFSQGSIFSVNGGAEPVWRVVSWQGVDLEAGQRLRGGAFSASKLDLGHSSASSFARAKWKGLFG